jgi:hypothetical protein
MHKFTFLSLVIAAASLTTPVRAYDLGSMTCEDIGNWSREVFIEMNKGVSLEAMLARLDAMTFNAEIEKRNLADVINVVYGPHGQQWSEDGAYSVMKHDCEIGQQRRKRVFKE